MRDWKPFAVPVVRAILQLISGLLMAKGVISQEDSTSIVGAAETLTAGAIFLGSLAWSIKEKHKTAELHAAKDAIISDQKQVIQAKTAEIANLK